MSFQSQENMVGAVKWAAAALAVLPGVSFFTTGAWAPPKQEELFGGVMIVFGTLVLLVLVRFSDDFRSWTRIRMCATVTALSALGFAALAIFGYARLVTVFEHSTSGLRITSEKIDTAGQPVQVAPDSIRVDTAYFPLFLSGRADSMVRLFGSRRLAVNKQGVDPIRQAVAELPGSILVTNAIFLALYLIMNSVVVASLSISAWNLAGMPNMGMKPEMQGDPGSNELPTNPPSG